MQNKRKLFSVEKTWIGKSTTPLKQSFVVQNTYGSKIKPETEPLNSAKGYVDP